MTVPVSLCDDIAVRGHAHWAIRVDLRTGRVNKSSHIKLPEFRYLWRDFHSKGKS